MLGEVTAAPQHTLKSAIGCRGVGLHSGRKIAMRLLPAPPDSGIVFRRTDLAAEIPARWENAIDSVLCTALANENDVSIGTIEHLMAAFAGFEVDNALIELEGPEVPIMDGSAAPFAFLIECAGVVAQEVPRRAIEVLKPVSVVADGATAELVPQPGFSMSFEIDFDTPLIRRQNLTIAPAAGDFAEMFRRELGPARTFGLIDEVVRLKQAGLVPGGSLENAVVVSGERILTPGGLRYRDEFVRHKLLDALGDLYLAGGPLIGQFRGARSGHAQTRRLLAALFADAAAWRYTSLPVPARPAELDAAAWQPRRLASA